MLSFYPLQGVIIPPSAIEKKPDVAAADSVTAASAADGGPVLLGQFRNERCCIRCEEAASAELGTVLRCRGCQNSFHPACLEQDQGAVQEEEKWRCPDCLAGLHPCFICKLAEGETRAPPTAASAKGSSAS
jgi:hypothetical protein